jgi:hypothetical protein
VFTYHREAELDGAVALFAQFGDEGPPALALFDTLSTVPVPGARVKPVLEEKAPAPQSVEPGILRSRDNEWTVNVSASGASIAATLRAGTEWVFDEDLVLTFRITVGEEDRVEHSRAELRWVISPESLEMVCAALEAATPAQPLRWEALPSVTLMLLPLRAGDTSGTKT